MERCIYYYSHSGNNEKLALVVQEKLGGEIREISEKKKRSTISILVDSYLHRTSKLKNRDETLKKYDCVVFVAPIWGGKIAAPMRTFMEQEINNISAFSFITVCNGTTGQRDKISEELSGIFHSEPKELCELWVNDLLPDDVKGKINHTFHYQVSEDNLLHFEKQIDAFVHTIYI